MESHQKAIYFLRIKRQKKKRLKKITDESEIGFNFSTKRDKHVFYPL